MSRLFFSLARWPLAVLHPLGLLLGWLAYGLSSSYRGRLKAHAQQAGLSAAQRRAAVGHAGKMVAELPRLWGRPHKEVLGRRVVWQGAEEVASTLAENRGVVLMTPHLGCFEMVAQAYAERFGAHKPITALYRPARQAWLAQVMVHARNRPGMHTSPATLTGVRHLLRALKRGETVGLLPDQVPPLGMGEWAPFFGRTAYTMTMAAKLVAQTGACVLLFRCERLNAAQRQQHQADYIVHASRASPQQEAQLMQGDMAQSVAIINQMMEALIQACPEQYLWGYSRYKQPRGEMLATSAKEHGA